MKNHFVIALFLVCMAACGDTVTSPDDPPGLNPDETKCQAPDYSVTLGEACDEVLRDCGNAICTSPLICVNSVCVSPTDAGVGSGE